MQHESLVWHDWMVEFMIWAISLVVRFIFQGVCADQLDRFYNWTLELVPSEALAIDSILHLFCLLVDPYTNPTMVMPIDILFKMVVEHKVDHNILPSLGSEVHQCALTLRNHVQLHEGFGLQGHRWQHHEHRGMIGSNNLG